VSSLRDQVADLGVLFEAATPEQQKRIAPKLAALKQLLAENPLEAFEPYPKQQLFLASKEPLKAFFGGNGAGKSVIGTVDDILQCVDREIVPRHLQVFKRWDPPVHIRVGAPKMGVIESTVLEKFREWTPKSQLIGGSFDKAYNKVTRTLLFRNGSKILFNTYDQDRDAWAGVELRRTRFDEEPEGRHGWDLYTESIARNRRFAPDAQICFTMTPLFGLSWTFDEVYERRGQDGVHVTVASMRDNPHIDSEATIRQLSHLSESERQAVIDGEFVHFHGAVLDVRERHVVPQVRPDQLAGQQCYVGIDPGIRRGGVVWVAFDRDNHMLVFDELYPESMTVPQIAAEIRAKNKFWKLTGENEPLYVIDPSARNRSLVNAENVEGAFAQEGIYSMHGQNDRRTGVLELRKRLEAQPTPALLVTENCVAWLFEAKRWLVAKDEVTEEQSPNAKGATFATIGPDHLMDPTRYVAMERVWWPGAESPVTDEPWAPDRAMSASWLKSHTPRGGNGAPLGNMS
jgi:phage terminase large subunit-like protein